VRARVEIQGGRGDASTGTGPLVAEDAAVSCPASSRFANELLWERSGAARGRQNVASKTLLALLDA